MATQNAEHTERDITTVNSNVIEVSGASVGFAMERGESRVLNDVSLDVQRGEILGIVGESGSGKSMLADAMLDAIDPPGQLTGTVRYHPPNGGESIVVNELSGERLRRFRWEDIAMVVQGALDSFNPTLTIRGHFEETLRAHGNDMGAGMERARQLLRDVHLDPDRVLDSYSHQLSGGMKQRALIALSLILEPNVLLMDEPTAALDLLMQQSILKLLVELRDEYDLTIVIVTHDLGHIARIADRLAVMYAFELLEIGPVQEVVMDASHPYTRALINSIPDIEADPDRMRSIDGTSPDPLNVPKGCSYHPRCPLADDSCEAENPDRFEVTDEHSAACFYREEARETIPIVKNDTE